MHRKVLRFLSSPIHIHIKLPFHQSIYARLRTFFGYYTEVDAEGSYTYIETFNLGFGAWADTDGRNLNVRIGAVLASFEVGIYQRFDSLGGC